VAAADWTVAAVSTAMLTAAVTKTTRRCQQFQQPTYTLSSRAVLQRL